MSTGTAHERGAALVTVLLAIVLLTVAVFEFAYSSQVDYSLAHNALKALQANCLARSGVNLAMLVLKKDGETPSGIDSLNEHWAQALPPLPAGQGVVTVRVTDEQGKLNLNALRNNNGTRHSLWQEVAQRLFVLRGLDPHLVDPIVDWLDSDDFPEAHGAERDHYRGLTPPYAPRNNWLLSLGELGKVEGLTPAVRAQLGDVVTALPIDAAQAHSTQVNVNTAPAEVLAALFPAAEPRAIEQFLASRAEAPVRGWPELAGRLGVDPRDAAGIQQLVTVRSGFFAVTALATVEPVSQVLLVVVQRRSGAVTPVFWHPVTPVATKG